MRRIDPTTLTSFAGDDAKWAAVVRRDPSADGQFLYAVATTGVYCRPSCASRLARRENIRFFADPEDAENAGYRACKRCRPKDLPLPNPRAEAVAEACRLIETSDEAVDLSALAAAAHLSPSYFHRVFKSVTGMTPKAYAVGHRARRLREALPDSARDCAVVPAQLGDEIGACAAVAIAKYHGQQGEAPGGGP